MPLAQDLSLDLLASSPARYHCTTIAPSDNLEVSFVNVDNSEANAIILKQMV